MWFLPFLHHPFPFPPCHQHQFIPPVVKINHLFFWGGVLLLSQFNSLNQLTRGSDQHPHQQKERTGPCKATLTAEEVFFWVYRTQGTQLTSRTRSAACFQAGSTHPLRPSAQFGVADSGPAKSGSFIVTIWLPKASQQGRAYKLLLEHGHCLLLGTVCSIPLDFLLVTTRELPARMELMDSCHPSKFLLLLLIPAATQKMSPQNQTLPFAPGPSSE